MSTISKMETPTGQEETAILLEEQARRIATLQESLKQACHNPHSNDRVIMQEVDRLVKERDDLKRKLENAEMLIERLKREVKELDFSVAMHDRNAALRTAEESSVVDRTPAKQPDDSSNTDGDGDSVIDDNHLQVELDREKRKNEALYRDFKGANDLYLAENLRAEKFQDALLRIRHLLWKDLSLHDKGSLYALLLHVFSIAHKALKVEDSIDEAAAGQQKNTAGELSDCEALRELIEKKLSQQVEDIKKAISSPTLSPELASIGRELVRLAEKSLEEVEE